jgi:hypothetical protein
MLYAVHSPDLAIPTLRTLITTGCQKSSAKCSNLLLRCVSCPNAYCEDCINFDESIILPEQPPPEFKNLGFSRCAQAVYITCSEACAINYDSTVFTAFDYPPGGRAPEPLEDEEEEEEKDDDTDDVVYIGVKK